MAIESMDRQRLTFDGNTPGRTDLLVGGVRTSILEAGRPGEAAVLFVHGNPGSADTWLDLIGDVAAVARCIAPDMPGYGRTAKPVDFEYTIDGYARFLGALLEALGVATVHLVGHDLGGVWALGWAASHPRQVASLTLMSIGAMPGYRYHRYARLYRIPLIGELILLGATRRAVARVLRSGTEHEPPDWFVDETVTQYRDRDTRRAVLAFYRATPDLGPPTTAAAAALAGMDPPTLVIWGAGDPYVPVRFAAVQKTFFPRAEVMILPGSGHWPVFDHPDLVSRTVAGFLRRQITPGPPAASPRSAP